jgi:hypothetical protein
MAVGDKQAVSPRKEAAARSRSNWRSEPVVELAVESRGGDALCILAGPYLGQVLGEGAHMSARQLKAKGAIGFISQDFVLAPYRLLDIVTLSMSNLVSVVMK